MTTPEPAPHVPPVPPAPERPSESILLTLWFDNTTPQAPAARILAAEPDPDRGFARKYLNHINPAWPQTHIGDFDMSRSAAPSAGEFYIGAYPGLVVVRVVLDGVTTLSQVPERYLRGVPAHDIYATAHAVPRSSNAGLPLDPDSEPLRVTEGYGAFAHWDAEGTLRRSFAANPDLIFEDLGLPHPAEASFWTQTPETTALISTRLPFIPAAMATAVVADSLGIPLDPQDPQAPDLPVSGFAIDGRSEHHPTDADRPRRGGAVGAQRGGGSAGAGAAGAGAAGAGAGDSEEEINATELRYDDYEVDRSPHRSSSTNTLATLRSTGAAAQRTVQRATRATASALGTGLRRGWESARSRFRR